MYTSMLAVPKSIPISALSENIDSTPLSEDLF